MIASTRIEGSRLAGNLLGDPAERDLYVNLPQGYEDSDARHPTAYLPHALGASAKTTVFPADRGFKSLSLRFPSRKRPLTLGIRTERGMGPAPLAWKAAPARSGVLAAQPL